MECDASLQHFLDIDARAKVLPGVRIELFEVSDRRRIPKCACLVQCIVRAADRGKSGQHLNGTRVASLCLLEIFAVFAFDSHMVRHERERVCPASQSDAGAGLGVGLPVVIAGAAVVYV